MTAAVKLRTSWPEGNRRAELYDVVVTAAGSAVNGWTVDLPVPADAVLRDSWGGTFTLKNGTLRIRREDEKNRIKNLDIRDCRQMQVDDFRVIQ